ncbi:hypothetical protein ABU162_29560 [Paenibacillus thiaminolyticus]|uniref:hypothetical protein n=1 Tax=Paenibacillus thiaminolyticus TaxID=49283 RepID=UPI0035A62698
MTHGISFIQEYPHIKEILEKLYLKRELDQWYIEESRKPVELPKDIHTIKDISDIVIQDGFSPSAHVYIKMKDRYGDGGFILSQEIQMRISKILPIYEYLLFHKIRHSSLVGDLGLVGPANTFELIETEVEINKMFEGNGYIKLSHEYDSYDTVYDWDCLKRIDPVNRRLTLKDAVFVDILDLCD